MLAITMPVAAAMRRCIVPPAAEDAEEAEEADEPDEPEEADEAEEADEILPERVEAVSWELTAFHRRWFAYPEPHDLTAPVPCRITARGTNKSHSTSTVS
jgi:hypothetical protein